MKTLKLKALLKILLHQTDNQEGKLLKNYQKLPEQHKYDTSKRDIPQEHRNSFLFLDKFFKTIRNFLNIFLQQFEAFVVIFFDKNLSRKIFATSSTKRNCFGHSDDEQRTKDQNEQRTGDEKFTKNNFPATDFGRRKKWRKPWRT